MLRTNLWNDSVSSRVALDQRAREAHLQLERIERLLVPRAPVTPSRRWRLLGLFKVSIPYGEWQISRARVPLRNRQPLRTRTIPEVWPELSGSCR
jgi:hypothetical protein